jgi:SAM-dependent methyltransferase
MDAQTPPKNEPGPVENFIARWQGQEGGQERANYALFLTELCDVLDLPHPDVAQATHAFNDYVFERAVTRHRDEGDTIGRIDLYRRNSFVLEAKQSRWKGDKAVAGQNDLFAAEEEPGQRGRRGAGRAWDVLMLNAKRQAEEYARALPASHGWPPFILVCDVGHCIEVYADFSGQGKNYTQFPDRQGFRIYLEDLRKEEIRNRLTAIWLEPQSLDPTRRAAKATRDIAERLAEVSKALEAKNYPPEEVAHFLMRCLFTMFAEDVKLLPENCFRELLDECRQHPDKFVPLLTDLWKSMNDGVFAASIRTKVLRFNGNLFAEAKVLPLGREEIGELAEAANKDWHEVEPAIFGTLLEQALDPAERKRLGAHYTPRAYVERLVVATIIEPLREDWRNVQATAETKRAAGDLKGAAEEVKAFHDQLCETRVLDPACGTGNFLYVAMELMKRLEGEVLEALLDLGGQEALRGLAGHTVDPHQLLGMEINPRAAAIAELVLWIGYLQWHFRTKGGIPDEPILRKFKNIEVKNAVLTWDGYPTAQFVDGKEAYPNPKRPTWPTAEFIVGNPPFTGGKDIRARWGDAYAEALWAAHKHMNESADFVMYWWDRAAEFLTAKGATLRRFGLVTTNSITQEFSRRVMKKRMEGKNPISLVMAIPDHPWTKATREAAAVRIAMTVAVRGEHLGQLRETSREEFLDTDEPSIEFSERTGRINADLTIGIDVTSVAPLVANEGLCSPGVKLHGAGFIVTPQQAEHLGLGKRAGLEKHIRPYRNGRDLTARPRGVCVIDLFGLDADRVQKRFPEVYQHVLTQVKPDREAQFKKSPTTDAKAYLEQWWILENRALSYGRL